MVRICVGIFYQDDEKKCCIAKATEHFFEDVLMKKNKQIGLIYCCSWYYMVLSWNEIKDRALNFSKEWADTSNEEAFMHET